MLKGSSREYLMYVIEQVSFAMDDVILFLDTHPDNSEALGYYQKCRQIRNEAMQEYTSKYGPISSYEAPQGCNWFWNKGPLPWQC